MTFKVLIVEDDFDFRDSLCKILNLEGFLAFGVGSIDECLDWMKANNCDALILDRNLPDGDGLEILRSQHHKKRVPTIIVTCEGEVEDRILGHDLDANYYLVKPIVSKELVSILQRLERQRNFNGEGGNDWAIDKKRWRLNWPELRHFIPLTQSEMKLMLCFVDKNDMHISREDFAKALGHDPKIFDYRRLEIMIRRLRNKAKEISGDDFPLKTAYGTGYIFNGVIKVMMEN